MAALWLDYQQYRPFHWAGPLLLALALLALLLSVAYYLQLNDRAAAWEEKLQSIGRGHGLRPTADGRGAHEPERLALEVKRANEVLRQLTLPWEQLFQTVEAAGDRKVTLLALEPDIEKQQVKISGEARDMLVMLNYIARLEEQEAFGSVFLQSHQVQLQDPERPVRFALIADWRGQP
ncbi:MAG: hypothetical protein HZB47_02805 [Nitrosomonadales bacterium]|nr:hypothetical protein [Nitrosomonadales bacterium]